MSKQTTTDFRERIDVIIDDSYGDIADGVIDKLLSAVSELVEECIPRVDKPIHITLIEKIGLKRPDEWTEKDNIEKGRIIERVEIRQRFKEKGITIK